MCEYKSCILVVDDNLKNIQLGINILKEESDYNLIFATSGEQVFQRVQEYDFDLILLDIVMHPMDGFEVCKRLKSDPKTVNIPIIFLSARNDTESLMEGFKVGGIDFITKPFNAHELKARVKTHLELKCYHDHEVEETQKEIILTMGNICEFKSVETGNHIKRVAEISQVLAKLSGLDDKTAHEIKWASAMHDMGKVVIPDAILNKPGKLTPEEFEIIKTHATAGYELLKHSTKKLLQCAAIIAHEHHEKWDGSGYPRGLKNEEIDIRGRIVAVADVFDALVNKRCYKDAWNFEETKKYMIENKGKHFDSRLIDIFFENEKIFLGIQERYKDEAI